MPFRKRVIRQKSKKVTPPPSRRTGRGGVLPKKTSPTGRIGGPPSGTPVPPGTKAPKPSGRKLRKPTGPGKPVRPVPKQMARPKGWSITRPKKRGGPAKRRIRPIRKRAR